MDQQTILTLIVIILGFAGLFHLLSKKLKDLEEKSKADQTLLEWLKTMQQSIDNTQKTINNSLQSSNKNITDSLQKQNQEINLRLDRAAQVIGELKKEAGTFSEVSKNMRDLQDYLKSPKLRGNIGEQVLSDLITQIFPKGNFFLQYQFKSGDKVDAAIKTDAGILCIDSKFPMENFQKIANSQNDAEKEIARKELKRDVKKHIDDISKKYILPEEQTMDFALMYLPSESVYYEVVNETELMEYARARRVYPVSPTTLYANLQTILLSFQGKKIEQKSKEVFALLRAAQKDYEKVDNALSILSRHITNAYNGMSSVVSSFTLLGQKLSSTKEIGGSEEKEEKLLPPRDPPLFQR